MLTINCTWLNICADLGKTHPITPQQTVDNLQQ